MTFKEMVLRIIPSGFNHISLRTLAIVESLAGNRNGAFSPLSRISNCIKCFILTFARFHNKMISPLGGNEKIPSRGGLILIE
jgi:hypothetical protein